MENKELIISKADLIKSISNPVRLCIVKKLTENETCNVRYLTNCMDISQSGISQHLGKLRDLGILGYNKEGQNVNYYIKNNEIKKIINVLFEEEENE
ncbi:MAG: helix-turn-helix transcriptional regulator [Erysipelotrichaceae bacterium]|nr:helix-turn-helix transcriptional regulator [Erysipelotrichaceae bacterium]